MDWSLARPRQVAVVLVVLLVFTVAGISRIRAETDFTRNFRQSSDVVVAYNFVEERLGGVGTLEMEFSAPDGLTPELADRLRNLETRLRRHRTSPKPWGWWTCSISSTLALRASSVAGWALRPASPPGSGC